MICVNEAEDVEALNTEWDPSDHFPFRHIERCSKLWVAAVNGVMDYMEAEAQFRAAIEAKNVSKVFQGAADLASVPLRAQP